jgi:hypothetical protein
MIDSTIAHYGYDEWKTCVITNKFHGHQGVFSVVGAKMEVKSWGPENHEP